MEGFLKLPLSSPDFIKESIEKLADLFPQCITENLQGKAIDFDKLKQELGHTVIEGNKERYRLEWPGKKEALLAANLSTTNTLRPVRKESVDFDNTGNIYIEGDNLEVLKILQESYAGKIKMIYIDPPYNTGKDFIYKDNFTQNSRQYQQESGQRNEHNQRLVANPETNGRYHSDWLTMMYPRLALARKLLKEDGVIFISIDDNESHNLRKLCDEIFGENNFVSDICVVNNLKGRNDKRYIAVANERLLMYVKSDRYTECGLSLPDERVNEFDNKDETGKYRELGLRKRGGADTREERPTMFFPLYINPVNGEVSIDKTNKHTIEVWPRKSHNADGCWRWGIDSIKLKIKTLIGRKINSGNKWDVFEKDYLETDGIVRKIKPKSVFAGTSYSTDRATKEFRALLPEADFTNPKPVAMLSDLIEYAVPAKGNELILDFFSGAASTAHAIMELNARSGGNRKFIMVQLPEAVNEDSKNYEHGFFNICEIGKERIRRAAKKINAETGASIDYGFRVYRLADSNTKEHALQEYTQKTLDLFTDAIKTGRTDEDLLTQVILASGLPLSLNIEQTMIAGKQVFKVAENLLYACFDKNIDETVAGIIADELPLRVVFRDHSFKNDMMKINVKNIFKQHSSGTDVKVI